MNAYIHIATSTLATSFNGLPHNTMFNILSPANTVCKSDFASMSILCLANMLTQPINLYDLEIHIEHDVNTSANVASTFCSGILALAINGITFTTSHRNSAYDQSSSASALKTNGVNMFERFQNMLGCQSTAKISSAWACLHVTSGALKEKRTIQFPFRIDRNELLQYENPKQILKFIQ